MIQRMYRTGDHGHFCRHDARSVSRFFFALLSLARFSISLGFIDRPLCAGFLWGLITGDMATTLCLAIFYEFFWLDLFPAGTYIPPNALFPMFCILSLAETLPDMSVAALFLPVILSLPLAFFGAHLEKRRREWQVAGYNRVIRRFRTGADIEGAAGLAVWGSLFQLFTLNFVAFFCVTWLVLFAFGSMAAWQAPPLTFPHASWPLLWTFGAVGGVIALRIKRSYAVFVTGGVVLGLLAFWGISL